MPRYFAAHTHPVTLASGRPLAPGEHIDHADLLPPQDPDAEPDAPAAELHPHDQRLIDTGRLLPAPDDEPADGQTPPEDQAADDQADVPSPAVITARRGRRPAEPAPKD